MVYIQVSRVWNRAKQKFYKDRMYDSIFEAGYAMELDFLLKAKEIKAWWTQVKCPLVVNGFHIANYYVDFKVEHNDGSIEYVETKGYATDVWRMKWRIFEATFGIEPGVRLTVIKQNNALNLRHAKRIK